MAMGAWCCYQDENGTLYAAMGPKIACVVGVGGVYDGLFVVLWALRERVTHYDGGHSAVMCKMRTGARDAKTNTVNLSRPLGRSTYG